MTNTVLLRDVIASDLPIFFEHQLDPDANTMAAFPPREREAFMAHWAKILGDDTLTKETILFDGHVAGNMVCFELAGEKAGSRCAARTRGLPTQTANKSRNSF